MLRQPKRSRLKLDTFESKGYVLRNEALSERLIPLELDWRMPIDRAEFRASSPMSAHRASSCAIVRARSSTALNHAQRCESEREVGNSLRRVAI